MLKTHMLVVWFCVVLVLGVSLAFAEDPYLTDQEVLQAWGQIQSLEKTFSDPVTLSHTRGHQKLTDEELDKVNAGGFAASVRDATIRLSQFDFLGASYRTGLGAVEVIDEAIPAAIDETIPMMPMGGPRGSITRLLGAANP